METRDKFLCEIAKKYEGIKKSFILNMKKEKMDFDEDLFQDTLLKCAETYKDDVENIEKMKSYFWVAYRQNMLKKLSRLKHGEDIDGLVGFDIIDEEYNSDIDEFVDIARYEIDNEFGTKLSDLWFEHVTMGKTYEEIEEESGITNIHYQFKKIRKYIREEIPKKNERFRELLGTLR